MTLFVAKRHIILWRTNFPRVPTCKVSSIHCFLPKNDKEVQLGKKDYRP